MCLFWVSSKGFIPCAIISPSYLLLLAFKHHLDTEQYSKIKKKSV